MARVPGVAELIDERSIEGSWILDAQGRTLSISDSAAALLGYVPREIEGRSPLDLVDADDAACLTAALARRRDGERESYEIRWRRRDGGVVWALIAAAPMRGPDGEYAGSFALITDVTGRRRADERLARQASQQRAIADLGRLALEADDTVRLFDVAVRLTAETLGAEYTGIFRRDDDALQPLAVHGVPAGTPRDVALTRDEAAPSLARLVTGDPVIIPDWRCETELRLPPVVAERLSVRSTVGVPIKGRALHGVLVAARSRTWHPDEDELHFLESAAHVLAAALDRTQAETAGTHRALHDALTGLPNRTLVLDRLDQSLRRRREEDGTGALAVLSVDLDRFKRVNDAYGVAAGDGVVRTVAERLTANVPPADTVARLAGDTFVLLCDDLPDEETAGAIAARIVEVVRDPLTVGGEDLTLTASVGVALARSGDEEAGALLRDADTAMDRAKASGRDRFELFDEALRTRAADRVQLERDLHLAIARGELFVAHQPIVAIGAGRVIGTEALVRWRHPARGVVPPLDFIGLAEETGLIADIGLWVLRQACTDVAARHRAGHPLTCHVNLSPVQATDPALPDRVAEVLRDTGLPPESLVLELTESSLMEAGERPLAVMQGIRELGVRLVLDDFGTGYSSLARLRHFPVDGLKVDRSFVADLESGDPAGALLISGIVELARALGLTVVAEGVETRIQLERLERIGCRYAQGYLTARPGDLAQLDALLDS